MYFLAIYLVFKYFFYNFAALLIAIASYWDVS